MHKPLTCVIMLCNAVRLVHTLVIGQPLRWIHMLLRSLRVSLPRLHSAFPRSARKLSGPVHPFLHRSDLSCHRTALGRGFSTHFRALQAPPTDTPNKPTLRENIYTLPNILTVSRILACPVLGWSILEGDFVLSTALLLYASVTDLVCNLYFWELSAKT